MNHKLEETTIRALVLLMVAALLCGCVTTPRTGSELKRQGDEIAVAGRFFHTGTPVVLWLDPGGYDAYRVERRFAPLDDSSWETSHVAVAELKTPNRYGRRNSPLLTPELLEQVRGGGWDLPLLQQVVDQFVIHYDVAGTSRQCFKILHDMRDLSVHFLLDLDGTIYQTLDVKERAWHATTSNSRAVGIEIASPGSYPVNRSGPLDDWYWRGSNGLIQLKLPARVGDGGIRTKGFIARPARAERIKGAVQGQEQVQYDFTPEQYRALARLTATLCTALPKIRCDYPRDASGKLLREKLPDDELEKYSGLLGHYHIQRNKVDPGPAFQWDLVINNARDLMWRSQVEPKGGARALISTAAAHR